MSIDYFSELKNRIKWILDEAEIKPSELAEIACISDSAISQIVSGANVNISKPVAKLISYEFGLPFEWILSGIGESPSRIQRPRYHAPGLVPVVIHSAVAVGPGRDDNEQEHEPQPIEIKKFPAELVNGYRDGFKIAGSSMEPTLSEDDYVGIDFDDKKFIDGKMYLIHRSYEGFSVKRLEDHPDGILIRSDR